MGQTLIVIYCLIGAWAYIEFQNMADDEDEKVFAACIGFPLALVWPVSAMAFAFWTRWYGGFLDEPEDRRPRRKSARKDQETSEPADKERPDADSPDVRGSNDEPGD